MKFLIFILFLLLAHVVGSQLSTSGAMTPAQLVQNVLVGQGVTVSNVTYNGAASAIGRFNGSNTSVGLNEGVILTTGTINSGAQGPYGPNDKPDAGLDNGSGGYGPLSALVGNSNTYNAAILEFDFVPQSDTVRFEYVFGSEEYPEFVGTEFNDVFAFFISGPGINGQKNMALIPGTNSPVAINNVNNGPSNNGPCNNCQHYVNNGTGNNAPFNNNNYYVQYDGLTKPLKAVSKVECGKTYHLVIAIADVGDPIYDSGIFLSANSLSSKQPVTVSYSLSSNPYGDGVTMAQGCTSATVTVRRSGKGIDQPISVPVNLTTNGIEGVDFTNIPTVINFAANQTEVTFAIDALYNPNLTETVNIALEFETLNPCDEIVLLNLELFVNPVEDVAVTLESSEILCPGEELELIAQTSGGGGGYTFLWSTGETTPSIFVNPESTETYSVQVTDDCLNQTIEAEGTVTVPVYDEVSIEVTEDIVEQCPYVPFDLSVDAIGGAGNFTYQWIDDEGNLISNVQTVNVLPSRTSIYTIIVKDQCGTEVTDEVKITILSPPLTLQITAPHEICPGDSTELTVVASGGFGEYYYDWVHNGDTNATTVVNPNQTTTYNVNVSDDCQTFEVLGSTHIVVVKPDADFKTITEPMFIGLPITFENLSENANSYYWDFGDLSTSTLIHPNNTYLDPGFYEVQLIAVDLNGCVDTIVKTIEIQNEFYLYVPNAFTPADESRVNRYFEISEINIKDFSIQIFNRWGELVFQSEDANFSWDGTYNGRKIRDGTYVWKIKYTSINGDDEEIMGHVTVLR